MSLRAVGEMKWEGFSKSVLQSLKMVWLLLHWGVEVYYGVGGFCTDEKDVAKLRLLRLIE